MPSALAPALSFLTPLCAVALILRYKPALPTSSALLALSLSAIASGVVDLTDATQAQLIVKTCLYAQLGASAIYLAHRHTGYSLVLTGLLFCGTALGLATPFVRAIPTIVPPLLFLLFTLSTLPLLAHTLFSRTRTTSIAQVPIPPPLPSPAASSITSFPSSDDKQEITSSACSASFPYKNPPLASAESGSTPAPHTGIKHRAQIIQTRSRNIILTLLASQLLTLLSDTLFLIAALIPHSQAIKSIQTFFLVLSICGFMSASALHGQRLPINPSTTPPSTRISISVSISKRQDQPNSTFLNSIPDHHTDSTAKPRAKLHSDDNVDNTHHHHHHHHHRGVNTGDCPSHLPPWKDNCLSSQPSESRLQGQLGTGLGLSLGLGSSSGDGSGVGRFERFRKFFGVKKSGPSKGEEQESVISLKDLHHPQIPTTQNHRHTRFAPSSSSFSSPPRYNQNDSQPRVRNPDIQTHAVDISGLGKGKEDEKKFDDVEEGVELPVLLSQTLSDSASIGQLPSPPDTPRARVHSSTTTTSATTHVPYTYSDSHLPTTYCQRQNNTTSSFTPPDIVTVITTTDHDDDSSNKEEEEEVRIGMVTSAEKPNLTIRDIFIDAEQYEEACERGEVVDSAVSEPGHGSREYFDFGEENRVHNSPRVLVSPPSSTPTPTPTPAPTPIPTPVLRSPTFSSPSSWMTSNFKRPMKSRSMMSLPLSFGSGPGSATDTRSPRSPTLSWKGAGKLKEKLKRPLGGGGHGRALSLSQSPTLGHSARKEEGLFFVEGGEGKSGGKGQHKRKGSTWSSLGQKSPTFLFTSNVPATATTAATTSTSTSSGSEWEWYPSLSKSKPKPKSSTTNLHNHQGEVLTSSISNKKKREQTATSVLTAPRSSSEQHQQQPMSDTADFVDLTDPFASPTPGFALPKWVGNNGSSVTAGSGASGSVGPCGLGVGGNWNGSVSDVGHGGYYSSGGGGGGGASSSWCHDSGGESYHDVYVNEKETIPTTLWNVPKTIKPRSGAQWGKLPPVPSIPSSSLSDQGHYGYDGLKKKRERLERVPPVATMMATGGGKRTRPSRRRPDSPMPMKTLSGTTAGSLMRVVDDAEDEDVDREVGEGEIGMLERPGSPVPHLLSRSPSPSPLTLTTAMELGIKRDVRVLGSTVVLDNTVDVLRGGRLQKKTNATTDPNAKNHVSGPNGRKSSSGIKNGGVKSRRGRNGSPVPIPFRRNRHAGNNNVRGAGVLEEEPKEEGDTDVIDGLNLEEVLLVQRLLRRLNSDEGSV